MLKRTMLLAIATATLLAPAALAGHDGRFEPAHRLVVLADDLANATDDMQREVAHRQRGHRAGELLVALNRLERQAERFRYDVARNVSPRSQDLAFDRLLVAFDRADRAMRFVRNGRLQREFLQVENAMRRLVDRVEIARGPRIQRRDGRLHGAIVLGDRHGDSQFQVRIGF